MADQNPTSVPLTSTTPQAPAAPTDPTPALGAYDTGAQATTSENAEAQINVAEVVTGVPELTDEEKAEAQKQGVKGAIAEAAAKAYRTTTPATASASAGDRWPDRHDIMRYESLLDLDPDAFEKAVATDADPMLAESKVAGLLGLERSGKNRTPYVKAMMDRLGVDSPYEVTHAGKGYTNDVTTVTKL